MKKVLVTTKLTEQQKKRLEEGFPDLQFVYEKDDDVNIILGNYPAEKLKDFPKLEWIQTGAVGVEKYMQKGILKDGVILTNAVDVHSQEVAEHVLAMILAMVKKLYLYRDDQAQKKWIDEGKVKEIGKLKVAIVGLGDIGKTLARMLKGLNVHVIGVKRTLIDKPAYVDELYTSQDLDKAISDVDVVVTLLPGNKANRHLFTVDTFRKMRKDTVMVNAGRGNLYSYETLKTVLDEHIIEAISTDVYEEEPVKADSELWNYRNLVMTPHIAGSYHLDSAKEKFLDLCENNLHRYMNGEELLHIVKERE